MKRILTLLAVVSLIAALGVAGTASASPSASGGGSARAAYNAIPSKVSGNVPSQGFECCQTNEFGDEVGLAGTARILQSMTVVLSSWGCENGDWTGQTGVCTTTPGATFSVPITFRIYAEIAPGIAGSELATQTQTVAIPYRPSSSTLCDGGRWYNSKDRTCYNGLPVTIKMSFATGVTLPDQVIWSVAYNTTTSGYTPIGVAACNSEPGGCGYDSLNVGAYSFPNAPYAGTDTNEDEAFRNGAMESGWTGYRPLGAIVAK